MPLMQQINALNGPSMLVTTVMGRGFIGEADVDVDCLVYTTATGGQTKIEVVPLAAIATVENELIPALSSGGEITRVDRPTFQK